MAFGISSSTRDWTHDPALEAGNLNHWTAREVLKSIPVHVFWRTHVCLSLGHIPKSGIAESIYTPPSKMWEFCIPANIYYSQSFKISDFLVDEWWYLWFCFPGGIREIKHGHLGCHADLKVVSSVQIWFRVLGLVLLASFEVHGPWNLRNVGRH